MNLEDDVYSSKSSLSYEVGDGLQILYTYAVSKCRILELTFS